jgi:hypothetical protein
MGSAAWHGVITGARVICYDIREVFLDSFLGFRRLGVKPLPQGDLL